MFKKLIAILLTLCLLAGLCCAFAAEQGSYVALGDSIADGFRLEGYTVPGSAPADSYPVLVAAAAGYELVPLAVSGMDTPGLLAALETEAYRSAISEAELITLSIGSNDLLKPAITKAAEAMEGQDLSALEGADMTALMGFMSQLNDALTNEESLLLFQQQVDRFRSNWDSIIGSLRALNPDAVIIATSFYNPFTDFDFSMGGVSVTVGSTTQGYLDQMNAHLAEGPLSAEYLVADIREADTNVNLSFTDMSAIDLDPHPSKEGHAFIASALLSVLETAAPSGLRNFKEVISYSEGMYSDLPAAQWARDGIRRATELGLMQGSGGAFDPEGELTVAQALAMAARVRSIYTGDGKAFDQSTGEHWYDVYVLYCISEHIIGWSDFSELTRPITRAEMAYVFARTVDAEALGAINEVSALPDVTEADPYGAEIFTLYRAGVLTGNDAAGTFTPNENITRAQAAAIISRVADPALRASLNLG